MPNSKSALKALRQSKKRRVINLRSKRILRSSINTTKKSIRAGADDIQEKIRETIQIIDKAAQKGVIKKGNAARRKTRLFRTLANLKK